MYDLQSTTIRFEMVGNTTLEKRSFQSSTAFGVADYFASKIVIETSVVDRDEQGMISADAVNRSIVPSCLEEAIASGLKMKPIVRIHICLLENNALFQ